MSKRRYSEGVLLTIYNEYPRKVARKAALTAIDKALRNLKEPNPVEWLLERVKLYASSREGHEKQYTPYPATWFNQERFHDDESEWFPEGAKPADPHDIEETERVLRILKGA